MVLSTSGFRCCPSCSQSSRRRRTPLLTTPRFRANVQTLAGAIADSNLIFSAHSWNAQKPPAFPRHFTIFWLLSAALHLWKTWLDTKSTFSHPHAATIANFCTLYYLFGLEIPPLYSSATGLFRRHHHLFWILHDSFGGRGGFSGSLELFYFVTLHSPRMLERLPKNLLCPYIYPPTFCLHLFVFVFLAAP